MGSTPTGRFGFEFSNLNSQLNQNAHAFVLLGRLVRSETFQVHLQHVGKFGIPSVLGTEDRRFESGHADLALAHALRSIVKFTNPFNDRP